MGRAKNAFKVSFEGDYVRVLADGEKDMDFARRLWREVARVCEESGCYRVLGIANSTKPQGTSGAYEHAELFESLGFRNRIRVAWVERNPDAVEAVQFIETVLLNRYFPVRLFTDIAEAEAWLLEKGTG